MLTTHNIDDIEVMQGVTGGPLSDALNLWDDIDDLSDYIDECGKCCPITWPTDFLDYFFGTKTDILSDDDLGYLIGFMWRASYN